MICPINREHGESSFSTTESIKSSLPYYLWPPNWQSGDLPCGVLTDKVTRPFDLRGLARSRDQLTTYLHYQSPDGH